MAVLTPSQQARIRQELEEVFVEPGSPLSAFVNDEGYIKAGAPVSAFPNDAGYVLPGSAVSQFTNDAGYLQPQIMIVQDQKPAGTAGGTFTSGAWQTRDLNTIQYNSIPGASLASNRVTLPAGTYLVKASAPAFYVGNHKTRLYNFTGSSTLIAGSLEMSFQGSTGYDQTRSFVLGSFTLVGNTAIELQHRCYATRSTDGFGGFNSSNASTWGEVETYSQVEIQKIG